MCAESPSALGPESSGQAIVHISSVSMLTPLSKYRVVAYKICLSQPSPEARHGLWPLRVADGGRYLSAGGPSLVRPDQLIILGMEMLETMVTVMLLVIF